MDIKIASSPSRLLLINKLMRFDDHPGRDGPRLWGASNTNPPLVHGKPRVRQPARFANLLD